MSLQHQSKSTSSTSRRKRHLIDVRTPAEYQHAGNAIPGAINVEYQTITSYFIHLPSTGDGADKDTPILMYCRSGRRSAIAKTELEALGFSSVRDLGSAEEASHVLEREGLLDGERRWIGGDDVEEGVQGNKPRDSGRGGGAEKEKLEQGYRGLLEGLREDANKE